MVQQAIQSQTKAVTEEGWGDWGDFATPPQSLVLVVGGTIEQSSDYVFSFSGAEWKLTNKLSRHHENRNQWASVPSGQL
jgi:hypothetical protein